MLLEGRRGRSVPLWRPPVKAKSLGTIQEIFLRRRRPVALLLLVLLPPAACKDSRSAVPISQAAPIAVAVGTPDPPYFPRLALDSLRPDNDGFRSGWYGKALAAMAEPRLFVAPGELPTETLRFLWLRTFHHPVAVRVERRPDGCAVTTTVLDGQGGYEPGATSRRLI